MGCLDKSGMKCNGMGDHKMNTGKYVEGGGTGGGANAVPSYSTTGKAAITRQPTATNAGSGSRFKPK